MSGKELLHLMILHGWVLERIRGSHHIMIKDAMRPIPVPIHGNRDLPKGTLAAILRQAGIGKGR